MALNKQPVPINFAKGVNQKIDPFQLPVGEFLNLKNSVFNKAGRLAKRFGYMNAVANLPDTTQTTLTTLNDNLIATGNNLLAYSKDTNTWLNQGTIQPVQLGVQSLVRNSTAQTAPDAAIADNGLVCLVYMDSGDPFYQISDSTTGQQVIAKTALPAAAFDPRVIVMGVYFVITYVLLTGGANHIQYLAIPTANPSSPGVASNISTDVNLAHPGYDISVANNTMYIAWNASTANIHVAYLNSSLVISTVYTEAGKIGERIAVYADPLTNIVWVVSTHNAVGAVDSAIALDLTLTPIMAPTNFSGGGTNPTQLTCIARGRTVFIYENSITAFAGAGGTTEDFGGIQRYQVTLPVTGVGVGTHSSISSKLSVQFASKPFLINTRIYMLAAYGNTAQTHSEYNSNQPSYFLLDEVYNVYMRLAYSNGGGYPTTQVVPGVNFINDEYQIPYLVKDFLTTVNKGTSLPSGTPTSAIYTQTGINLAQFSLNNSAQHSSEIANVLHLTGGQMWEYDGVAPVEEGFQVWPENPQASISGSGGTITAGTYYYVFTYEWTDNQGNLYRSAPSIPLKAVTSGSTSSVVLDIPSLQLTYKANVRVVGYRWSTNQQVYYQFTSVTSPTLNAIGSAYTQITDTLPDSSILGNTLLYTTGGVVENIAAPASIASALFNNRLWIIDAEDRNLLWYSKQVIQNTPVEMSDLLTLYVAPTTGAQGSTGPMTAISAMDDKLVIFKKDAIYYVNGTGPDNTGANSQYSDPVFIIGTVGCSNPNSIVLMPTGLMFQSDKGIWMLGRDLSTSYVGAPVEDFNSQTVMSATAIPATNQVRFVLSNNNTLMYDYFYSQWAIHSNVKAISATIYQGAHTYLNSEGSVFQEAENYYKDGSVPVLMSLTTSWINVAGLQGYERFYFANLLGTYFTPFKLQVELAYDYNASAKQAITVTPDNFGGTWGSEALWGTAGPWGGVGNVFSARCFPQKQKCESFQVTINELYDSTLGIDAGQGLTLSGLLLTVGIKRGSRTQSAKRSFG